MLYTHVVCQKRNKMRLFYEEKSPTVFRAGAAGTTGESKYINPCVGLCMDATGSEYTSANERVAGAASVCSARYNEFYLNSHAAVLGTSRPCRYTLLYDTIGMTVRVLLFLI